MSSWDDFWNSRWKGFRKSTAEFWTDPFSSSREWDEDDYESMSWYADSRNPMSGYARNRKKVMENDELEQWKQDYQSYTGVDLSKSRYPIRKGLYQTSNDTWTIYDTLDSVLGFYGDVNLRKWI